MHLMHLQVKRADNGRVKVLRDKQASSNANAKILGFRQKERRSACCI